MTRPSQCVSQCWNDKVFFDTLDKLWQDQVFCFIDCSIDINWFSGIIARWIWAMSDHDIKSLISACQKGDIENVEKLIAKGIDINAV